MKPASQLMLDLPIPGGPTNDYTTSVGTLSEIVFNWAENAFPHRTDVSLFLKLYSEIAEMIESHGDASEVADMFILLLDYAKRKKVDVTQAVMAKIAINHARQWTTDQNGVNKHV